jgi:methyl-accepting chemotaxis protein
MRGKTQWFARHEAIGKILNSASKNFQEPDDKKNIDELFKNHESIKITFSAIVENRGKNKSTSDEAVISQEVEDRLISQLNIKVYEVVLHGRELLVSSRKARSAALRLAGGWTAAVLMILIGAMIINSRTMARAITDRVRRLRDGALVIGGGDLDHRIDIRR